MSLIQTIQSFLAENQLQQNQHDVLFAVIYFTCLDYGLVLFETNVDLLTNISSSAGKSMYIPLQFKTENIVIRVVKTENGIVLQGLGTTEIISPYEIAFKTIKYLTNLVPIKQISIQQVIYHLKSVYLPKLVTNEYGNLHLLGLNSSLLVRICSYLKAILISPHDFKFNIFFW